MDRETVLDSFNEVQSKVQLKEGLNGLLKFFAAIDRFPNVPNQEIAQEIGLPVPLCVAIRNEFEKLGWCTRDTRGAIITPQGKEIISTLSIVNKGFSCTSCTKAGLLFPLEEFSDELNNLVKYSTMRGKPNTVIDQSYASPQTSFLRILLMMHNYDLLFDNYAFVGDSDLTSIALAMMVPLTTRITVFDIDPKVGEIIGRANKELNLGIKFVEHDLRTPIPKKYEGQFDCFLTDPPYTIEGLKLFISRGIQLISKERDGIFYLSFGAKPPEELLIIQRTLTDMSCLVTDIIPSFNEYIGAQKLGGVSTMYRALVSKKALPLISDKYEGPLYTGDLNPIIRIYLCLNCKKEYRVGKNQPYSTIEQLKNQGCKKCNSNKFKKKSEKKME